MKRALLYLSFFLFVTISFTSCESLGSCKICKQVVYVNGDYDHDLEEGEYCDAELIAIEATDDIIIGNTVTKWECR